MRKLLSLFVAALFSVTMFAADKQLYLKVTTTGANPWSHDTQKFAIYGFGAGEGWSAFLTEVEGEDAIYTGTISDAFTKIIFVRFSSVAKEPKWENNWSQTKDLDFPTGDNDLFTITTDSWGNDCDGVWSKFVPSEPETPATTLPVVAIAGDKISKWKADSLILVPAKDSLTASITVALKAGIDSFKVVSDGKWLSLNGEGETFYTFHRGWKSASHINGVDGRNFVLTADVDGDYTFTWTFKDSTLAITFPAEPVYRTVYFKSTAGFWNWDYENRTATGAYAWGEGVDPNAAWPGVRMTPTAGEEDIWEIELEEKYTQVIFTRVNAEGAIEHKALKTADLVIPTDGKNLYTLTRDTLNWTIDSLLVKNGIPGEWGTFAPAKFYVTGDSALAADAGNPGHGWDPKAIRSEKDTLILNLKANQEYMLKVIEDGDWDGGKIYGYDELTEKPAGLSADKDRNIHFQLAEAGNVQIIYIATVDTTIFKVVGNFYVEPEKPKVTLKLVPGEAKADGAKFAVWCWGPKQPGAWTEFFTGEGDTLTTQLEQDLDSVIFARFCDKASEPMWGGKGNDTIWNNTGHKGIDYEGLTFTITSMFDGQWEAVKPVPEHQELKLVPGVWVEDKAKFAVYVWNNIGLEGAWYELTGAGDTLSATVPGAADKAIFARFCDTVTIYRFNTEGDTVIWDSTGDQEIEDCGILFVNTWNQYSWCEAVAPVVPSEEDGYFLIGTLTQWKPLAAFKFEANPGKEGEYSLATTLKEGDEFKVAEQKNKAISDDDWYLSANHVVTAAEAGEVTIYFRPDAQGGEGWIEGIIFIDNGGSTGVEETAVQGKAVKALRDGQLVIIKNGVRYNVIGIRF